MRLKDQHPKCSRETPTNVHQGMGQEYSNEVLEAQIGFLMNLKKPKSFDVLYRVFGWCANAAEPINSKIMHDQLRTGLTGRKGKN